jgi:hypothetical protein
MLDGASPAAFDHLFLRAIEAAGPLTRFHCLGERVLIVLDGSEYFCSRKISCPQCSTRRRADGGTAYFHAFLGATLVAPGHHQVLPLPPECIAPQDGAEKQDGERNAAKRWLARHGRSVAHFRPIILGDDLFTCQPIAIAIQQAGGNFILTCKPSSHQTITEYLHGAELAEHRQTIRKGRQHTTIIYRWLSGVPLCASADAITVNWFSVEIRNAAGKRTYYNSFVTGVSCAWLALHRLRRANAGHIPGRGDRAGAVWPADRRRHPLPAALSVAAGEASGKAETDLFGVNLTTATIARISQDCAQRFRGFADAVREQVAAAPVKHIDQTGFRIAGKTQWLPIASTLWLIVYRVAAKRGSLLAKVTGVVVHDHWKPYYTMANVRRALCNAHHLRELKALIEIETENWAGKMQHLLRLACYLTNLAREREVPLKPGLIALIKRRYDAITAEGLAFHYPGRWIEDR